MPDRYASLKQGLVGCWIPSVSGSGLLLPDLSGRGNNGALTNMSAGAWVSGQYGRALDFDGSNDYVSVSSFITSSLQSLKAGTISAWLSFRSVPGLDNTKTITSASDTADSLSVCGFTIWDRPLVGAVTGVRLGFFVYEAQNPVLVSYGNTQLQLNTVYHVAFRQTGSSCEFYVNGVADGANNQNQAGFFSSVNTLNSFNLGGEIRSTGLQTSRIWDGNLDDIRIYNRALTEPEIRVLASEPGIGFKPAKKLSRFSQRFTYKPAKPRNYSVIRNRDPNYSTLRHGLVAAYCPSISGQGNVLPDLVGGNHGTLTNMDASDWVSSGDGRALDFDGVDDYVTFGNKAGDIAGPITVSAWVYMPTLLVSPNNGGILAKGNIRQAWPGTSYCLSVLGDSPQNTVSWAVFDDANNGRIGYFSSDGIAARTWTHVCGTYDGTGTTNAATKLYIQSILKSINGSEDAGTFVSMTTTTVDLEIGRRPFDASFQYAPIAVDDVRIYNRVLSLSEIKLLASKRGIGLEPRKPKITFTDLGVQKTYSVVRVKETDYGNLRQGLVGAWCPSLPNGGSGNTLPDVSGYGNHGSLVNMSPDDWVSSQYGKALDFDGVDDVVSCPQVPFTGTGNFSISIWVLQGTIRASDHAIKFGTATLNNAVGIFNSSGNNLTIGLHANNASEASLTGNLATNVFYHVVGTCTPTRREIWLNGVLQGTSTTTVNYDITSTFCNIGAAQSTLVPWNGRLDDIRVYSRVLSEPEIRLLASEPGIGLRQESHRNTFYQFPTFQPALARRSSAIIGGGIT